MNTEYITRGGVTAAVITGDEPVLTDVPSALDLIANTCWQEEPQNCRAIVIEKSAVGESFFDLKTRIAGEILQKFVNYHVKLAIYGDFSHYTSRSLRDFIRESNKGPDIFFATDFDKALDFALS